VGAFDLERVQERIVQPADPPAQIEPIRLQGRPRVASQETGNRVHDPLTNRVRLDQHELPDNLAGMGGGGIHDGSPSLLMEIPGARTPPLSSRYVDS